MWRLFREVGETYEVAKPKTTEEKVIQMGKMVAISMDEEFVDWWWNENPAGLHIKEDQTFMLIAWWTW